jgi:hypothetical protein
MRRRQHEVGRDQRARAKAPLAEIDPPHRLPAPAIVPGLQAPQRRALPEGGEREGGDEGCGKGKAWQ